MCAVCFTGFQAIPMAAVAGRAWWVKRSVMAGTATEVEEFADEFPEPDERPEPEVAGLDIDLDAERFVLA